MLQTEILQAPVGSLFSYNPLTATPLTKRGERPQPNVQADRDEAWDAAYDTMERVEFLLRGLAVQLPGTLAWKQEALQVGYWPAQVEGSPANPPVSPEELQRALNVILPTCVQVLDRLNHEGLAYMKVRAQRLQELYPLYLQEQEAQAQKDMEALWNDDKSATVALPDGRVIQNMGETDEDLSKNVWEQGTAKELEEELNLKDYDAINLAQPGADLIAETLAQNMAAENGQELADSEQVMKDSGFSLDGDGIIPPDYVGGTTHSTTLSSVHQQEQEEQRHRKLQKQEIEFLSFMTDTNGKSLKEGESWSQLSPDQRKVLEFLQLCSPTMSKEEEDKEVEHQKYLQQLEEAREIKANEKIPDPFRVEKTRVNFTPLEAEEEELQKKNLLDLLEQHDDGMTDEERQYETFLNQFASPGATVEMYNLLLDAIAVTTCNIQDPYLLVQHSSILHPRNVEFVFEQVICRHELDGGNGKGYNKTQTRWREPMNHNRYTCPNIVTFNAPLRFCAGLSYHVPPPKEEGSSEKSFFAAMTDYFNPTHLIYNMQRDEALIMAAFTFDKLNQCKLVNWNAASFAYMIQLCGKFLPTPSDMRGNVVLGLFGNAYLEGVVDGFVLRELVKANEPSNGEAFEKYFVKNGIEKDLILGRKDGTAAASGEEGTDEPPRTTKTAREDLARQYGTFPPTWTKEARGRRHLDFDSTY